jgi:thiol-disulfide isomerase/thioredoxin
VVPPSYVLPHSGYPRCGHCVRLNPVLDEVAAAVGDKLRIGKVGAAFTLPALSPSCSGSAPPEHPQQSLFLILDICAEPSLFLSQGFLSSFPPISPCYPQRMFSLIPIPRNPPQVDATIHTQLAKQFGISGYPSLKIFQPPSKEGEEARAFHASPLRFHPVPAAVTFSITLTLPPSLPPSLPLFLPLSPGGWLGQ